MPGARDNNAAWTAGNELWFFGGSGIDSMDNSNQLADLWRYDLATGFWTFMHGGESIATVPGTLGVSGPTNQPGARNDAIAWVDGNGDFWMFGGGGLDSLVASGHLADVWRYQRSTNEWTWMNGTPLANQPGIFGMRGVMSPVGQPGGRGTAASAQTATALWMFGGFGRDAAGRAGLLGDLWRYDMAANMWTWIAGTDQVDVAPVHGVRGVPDAANTPGARSPACIVTSGNDIFVIGGGAIGGAYNDVWRYSRTDDVWTWIGGSNTPDAAGVWGTRGIASTSNIPSARTVSVCWHDRAGDLWLFGGAGLDRRGVDGALADLWRFRPSTNEWTWVSGPADAAQVGVYGTRNVASPDNAPGSRHAGMAWVRDDGLWMFGGDFGFDSAGGPSLSLGDLWRFTLDP